MAGLTAGGFLVKTEAEIEQELGDQLKAQLGSNLDLSADGPLGIILGVMSAALAEQWEVAEQVYAASWLHSAEGVQADHLAQLYGTRRNEERRSVVSLKLTGTAGVVVPADSEVEFADHTWVLSADTEVGQVGSFTARDEGALAAAAGSAWSIATPVSGWEGVTQEDDAVAGADQESTLAMRARLAVIAKGSSASSISGIRAAILRLDGVTDCVVIPGDTAENESADSWGQGSLHVVVRGGELDEIAKTLLEVAPAGQRLVGRNNFEQNAGQPIVVEADGRRWQVSFSRPKQVAVWVEVDYELIGASVDKLNDTITAAILGFGAAVSVGQGVYPSGVLNAIYTAIAGPVFSQLNLRMGLSEQPQTAEVVPSFKDVLPVFAAERVSVTAL